MSKRYSMDWLLLSVLAAACGSDGTSAPPDTVYGKVAVRTVTSGSDPSSYLYAIEVDGSPIVPQLVGSNQRRILDPDFPAGNNAVELFGLPSNCSAAVNPETAVVNPPDTTEVIFTITCGPADPTDIALVFSAFGSIYELTPKRELYRLNGDGTGLVRLTSNSAADNDVPIWSPDGTRFLFSTYADPSLSLEAQIQSMNADGSGRATILHGWASSIAWSANGTKLAFFSRDSLWIMNGDGTGLAPVPSPAGEHPAWSSDGQRLAFEIPSLNGTIVIMNADGTGLTEITDLGFSGEMYRYPTWSQSDRILFFNPAAPPACPGCFYLTAPAPSGLNIMDPDGSNILTLAQQGGFGGVSWSPDGARVAMEAGNSLSIAKIDGTGVITLTIASVGLNGPPGWTSNGSLTFVAGDDIYSINADGTGLTQRSVRSMLAFLNHGSPVWRPR